MAEKTYKTPICNIVRLKGFNASSVYVQIAKLFALQIASHTRSANPDAALIDRVGNFS